nr:nonribosomal peptide synthetase [Brenneria rubrifaciens]
MCQKSNCKTVLIEEKHEKHNEFSNETEILNLDVLLNPVDEKTDYCYDDNDLAYIIFTSGTTGEPKGVMIQHKGLANHLVAKVKDLSLNDQDTLAQTASQCFDISLWQFLSALMVGGTTSIISSETIRDIPCFYAALNRFAITVVQYVPSLLNQFIEGIRKIDHCASLSTIRVIATVGEPLQPWLCKKWFAIFPHIPILNHYGPTECADGVMHHLITSTPTSGYTPIGKPIEGLTAYVIEPASEGDLKQVADGEIGELYVSGVGVSCGYINDAEKTASAFLSNPFQQGEQVSRLYKTGDLVKIRSDGLFECLGRTDRQVKLRGYRIELNEVDNVISKFEKIKISATKLINENKIKITSRENLENKTEQDYLPRLVTFIEVLAPVTRKELVDFIREKLPDYMVPDAFYQLGKIPTNSNGKLDYNALPSPDNIRPVIDTEYSPPQSSQEKQLCSIFSRVLHLDKVGIKDKFIELGGDSLRAMLAINFINKEMSCGVQLFELYNLTIDELAKKIENGDNRVMLPEITQSSASPDGNYPLSQTQRHLWFLWKLEPEIKNYILQTSFELTGHIDSNNIRSAWGELIESYDTFSIRFLEEGGEPFIRFSTPNTTLDELDFSPYSEEVQAEKLKEIKLKNAEYEFDLEKGPIYKALLIKMSDARAMILFTTHEIIMDAWSLSLLAKKFSSFYHHLPVEKEKIAFKDYVSWEKNHINKNSLSEQKRFWEQSLSGELPKILLPSDKKRPAIRSYRCDSVGFSLSSDDRNNLHAVAKSANATLFSTILAIFDLLIYNYTEQTDVIIGAPHVIREKSGTENLIGFFLNMLPLRVKIDEENHFIDYLSQVNEKVSHSLSHANYPFSWMLESLNFSRDSNVSPIFQIMFNMYSEQAENISTSQKRQELLVRVKEINNHYSKYDLVLYCQEENDTLYFQFTYCVDLFSRGYIIRMAENFKELITNIIKNTTSPIGDYPCLSSSEINFLEEYNNIQKARSGELISLSNTLNEALEKYKHDTAYIWKDGSITYSELDCYINSICFYLESKGCHDGARILIQNDRGIHCIALILACCKMGITYVVAGSYNSQKRVVAIAESLNPIAIVTDRLATGF